MPICDRQNHLPLAGNRYNVLKSNSCANSDQNIPFMKTNTKPDIPQSHYQH